MGGFSCLSIPYMRNGQARDNPKAVGVKTLQFLLFRFPWAPYRG